MTSNIFKEKINHKSCGVTIVGLGYVDLPLSILAILEWF